MVVRIEPLFHGKCFDISLRPLIPTGHGKVCVYIGKPQIGIPPWNGVQHISGVQHPVIKGKIIGRDKAGTCVPLACPLLHSLLRDNPFQLIGIYFAAKIRFCCEL